MPRVVKGRGWKSVAGWATGAALTAAWLAGAFLPVTGAGISKAKNRTAAMPRKASKASKPKRTRGRGIGKTLKRVALAAVPAAAAALAYRHRGAFANRGRLVSTPSYPVAQPPAIPAPPPLPPFKKPAELPLKVQNEMNKRWYFQVLGGFNNVKGKKMREAQKYGDYGDPGPFDLFKDHWNARNAIARSRMAANKAPPPTAPAVAYSHSRSHDRTRKSHTPKSTANLLKLKH